MKTEFISVPGKGLCILISELDINNLLKFSEKNMTSTNPLISNPSDISSFIREGKKIHAIKELRQQTGWGLKDSKEYIDKYMPIHGDYNWFHAADSFLAEHTLTNFLNVEEMSI